MTGGGDMGECGRGVLVGDMDGESCGESSWDSDSPYGMIGSSWLAVPLRSWREEGMVVWEQDESDRR